MTIATLLNGHLYHTGCCKCLSFYAKVRLTTLFSISCIKILPLTYEIKHISDCLLMYMGTSVITCLRLQACHLSQNTYVTYMYDCENSPKRYCTPGWGQNGIVVDHRRIVGRSSE